MRHFVTCHIEHPEAVGGILLHGVQQIRRLDERIVAVLWSVVAGAVFTVFRFHNTEKL